MAVIGPAPRQRCHQDPVGYLDRTECQRLEKVIHERAGEAEGSATVQCRQNSVNHNSWTLEFQKMEFIL